MKWKRREYKELKDAYAVVFGPKSGPASHAVFLDLFERCGMAKTSFVPGDPQFTAFNDGCRSIFVYIMQMAYEPTQELEKLRETLSTEFVND